MLAGLRWVIPILLVPAVGLAQTAPPVVVNAPPARWVLTQGAVIEGTQISEDAEYYVVRTASGEVRIRKVDVARIDIAGAAPVVAPVAAPVAAAPVVVRERSEEETEEEAAANEAAKKRKESEGAFWGGVTAFGVVYGLTFVGGAIGSAWDPEAVWLYVPLAGPLLYGARANVDDTGWALLGMLTFFQGGSFLALIVGTILWAAAPSADAPAPSAFAVTPWLGSRETGLTVTLAL